jgi:hypothetical protein
MCTTLLDVRGAGSRPFEAYVDEIDALLDSTRPDQQGAGYGSSGDAGR